MLPIQRLISTSFALLVGAAPALSLATPAFPGTVQTELGLGYPVPCALCHQGAPGKGTVTQPFGLSARARGLVPADTASLASVLEALDAEEHDSNCDGVSDIDELKDGRDPNTGAVLDGSDREPLPVASCGDVPETPAYGCGAQIAAGSVSGPEGAAVLTVLIGLALLRRRR